ncbi:MAG TPA: GNAT family N-acetyltransferase [Rhizobium sp.]
MYVTTTFRYGWKSNAPIEEMTMLPYEIRHSNKEDIPSILRLLRQIAAYSDNHSELGPASSDEQLLKMLKECTIFLLEAEGRVVGINAVQILDVSQYAHPLHAKIGFVMAFGVDETERRNGYGSALMQHMREWIAGEGVNLISLNVSASNHAAQAFYRSVGFEARAVHMEQILKIP